MRLRHAFKEWAVIGEALAEGKQALILRKGGVAEQGGDFAVEHTRFWLFPTYLHEKPEALKPEALPLLQAVEADRPPAGKLRLSHFAEVGGAYHVRDIVGRCPRPRSRARRGPRARRARARRSRAAGRGCVP